LAIFFTSETPRLTQREDFDEKERSPLAQRQFQKLLRQNSGSSKKIGLKLKGNGCKSRDCGKEVKN
jgi:hypothetical protein